MTLYQVDVGYACYGVIVDAGGGVIETADIARWMVGRKWDECRYWVRQKRGKVVEVTKFTNTGDLSCAKY